MGEGCLRPCLVLDPEPGAWRSAQDAVLPLVWALRPLGGKMVLELKFLKKKKKKEMNRFSPRGCIVKILVRHDAAQLSCSGDFFPQK